MRILKILFPVVLVGLLFPSCKEKDDDVFRATLTGLLMDSCGGRPLPNTSFEFWNEGRESDLFRDEIKPSLRGAFETDNTGRFSIILDEPLSARGGSIRIDNFRILVGQVLRGSSTEQDLGEVFANSMKRPVRYRFTNGSTFKPNDRIAIYQQYRGGIYRDTVKNLSGDKKGILWHDGYAYFNTKAFYDLSKDSAMIEGFARFHYIDKKDHESAYLKMLPCDTMISEHHINF